MGIPLKEPLTQVFRVGRHKYFVLFTEDVCLWKNLLIEHFIIPGCHILSEGLNQFEQICLRKIFHWRKKHVDFSRQKTLSSVNQNRESNKMSFMCNICCVKVKRNGTERYMINFKNILNLVKMSIILTRRHNFPIFYRNGTFKSEWLEQNALPLFIPTKDEIIYGPSLLHRFLNCEMPFKKFLIFILMKQIRK